MTRYHMTDTGHVYMTNPEVSLPKDCHPVVVISPEDRAQVERLSELIRDAEENCGQDFWEYDQMALAQALRELAAPTPPRPEEPTGLGAVVEDLHGRPYQRTGRARTPWLRSDIAPEAALDWRDFADITAVRVLSEGVTP